MVTARATWTVSTPMGPLRLPHGVPRGDVPLEESGATQPRVLLVTEGTYPYHWGGVSTWCDALIRALPDVPFSVLAIAAQPGMAPVFAKPDNVIDFRVVPLWGLKNPAEVSLDLAVGELRRRVAGTAEEAITAELVPPLRGFLRQLFAPVGDPETLADHVHSLYQFFARHDLDTAMRSQPVWQTCLTEMRTGYEKAAAHLALPELSLAELTTAFQWLSRWLFPLAQPLPEVDVVHPAMAGICSMVAVAVHREHGAGILLTEHGVYLRERYLAESTRTDSWFLKLLGLRFARRMTEMTYALAGQISPCCDYNQRWERHVGAAPEQLETIYYAVDGEDFQAGLRTAVAPDTVVWVGRINPLKDVETLLRAAALVAEERPDVKFLLYGSAPAEDAEYHQRCLALHRELNLDGVATFCGYTSDAPAAYNSGDIVVLSSISEGFPFSTLEAMLCGRPVVATSVGGIPEQIDQGGIVVEPRNPPAMAAALLSLLNDPPRCQALGAAARHRASSLFAVSRFRGEHLDSYLKLSPRHDVIQEDMPPPSAPDMAGLGTGAPPSEPAPAVPASRDGTDPRVPAGRDQAIDGLAERVRQRSPQPVDDLEVAALIESFGTTDGQAAERFGFPDTFRLAEEVFDRLNRACAAPPERSPAAPLAAPKARSHFDSARHPMIALLPPLALLTVLWAMTAVGRWPAQRVLAGALGMTAGMLFTNGVAIAMAPRASPLISFGKTRAARRFLGCCVVLALVSTLLLAEIVLSLGWSRLDFLERERQTFLVAAGTMSVVWCLAAALSLVSLSGWTGTALALGVVTGLGLDRALAGVTRQHGLIALAVALCVVIGLMVSVFERALRSCAGSPSTSDPRLPSAGFLLFEALPYYLYGTLGVAMFVSVHLVGWASMPNGGGWTPEMATLELGLFLPLPPVVLAAGRAERSLRRFWQEAATFQASTPARDPQEFGRRLERVCIAESVAYLRSLAVFSALLGALVIAVFAAFPSSNATLHAHGQTLAFLFITGLVGYGVLGWAQFNSMFGLSLLRCQGPLRAVATGTAVTVVTGVLLTFVLGFEAVGLALIAGAAAYAYRARADARRLLRAADLHYVMAL